MGRVTPHPYRPSWARTVAGVGSVRILVGATVIGETPRVAIAEGEVALLISTSALPTARPERRRCAAFLVSESGRTHTLPPGRFLMVVAFPAAALEGVGLPRGARLPVDGASALFWPFFAFAWTVAMETAPQTGLSMYFTERLLQEMLTGVIVASIRVQDGLPGHQPYVAAMSMITAQAGDPMLTPSSIAEELNLSLRTLQRHFSAQNTTIEARIRSVRVEQAVRLLEDRVYDSLSVERIAQACGFSNGSSLARAFASEGRLSPTVVRESSRYRTVAVGERERRQPGSSSLAATAG
ncbi:helix-turn-helix domain-containing protein [Microbacterium enclense]|uniref:Helix-turn-helix domain-containing protein n=1 Tax=Microbacterium enclense TaxID=993073 RepID=A0A443JFA8_9MICO|nr:helix-turn-helix domain-containing protein [Microbacterium enclense]